MMTRLDDDVELESTAAAPGRGGSLKSHRKGLDSALLGPSGVAVISSEVEVDTT